MESTPPSISFSFARTDWQQPPSPGRNLFSVLPDKAGGWPWHGQLHVACTWGRCSTTPLRSLPRLVEFLPIPANRLQKTTDLSAVVAHIPMHCGKTPVLSQRQQARPLVLEKQIMLLWRTADFVRCRTCHLQQEKGAWVCRIIIYRYRYTKYNILYIILNLGTHTSTQRGEEVYKTVEPKGHEIARPFSYAESNCIQACPGSSWG